MKMQFINDILNWFRYNFWWLFIVIILLVCLYLFLRLQKKPTHKAVKTVDDDTVDQFIESYGGISNIKNADIDGRRLKLTLINIELADIERFKSLGASGIFISGNNIKMVLPDDMNNLVNKINKNIDGGK